VETWMEVEAHQFHGPATAILHEIIVNPMYGVASNEQTIETDRNGEARKSPGRVRGKVVQI
jgi:hypothetical protein